jgi:hypothetical protein
MSSFLGDWLPDPDHVKRDPRSRAGVLVVPAPLAPGETLEASGAGYDASAVPIEFEESEDDF